MKQSASYIKNIAKAKKQFNNILLQNNNLNCHSRIPIVYSNELIDTTIRNSIRLQKSFKNNIKNGNYKNKATGYIASINSETKGKIIKPYGNKTNITSDNYILRLISANELPVLFKNAVYIDTLPAMKGKNNNYNELGYHHFVAPINIEGNNYRVLIVGKEKQNSKKIYSLNIEVLQQKSGSAPLVNTNSGYQSRGAPPTDMSISELINNVNIYNYNLQQNQVYNVLNIRY